MRSLASRLARSILTTALTACASSGSGIPAYAPNQAIPLPESAVAQIHTAAIRHFRRSEQQIMCIGVSSSHELDGSPMVVDAPEIFLRQLGSRDRFRPGSACRTSSSAVTSQSARVTTDNGLSATAIILGRPFGIAERRAVVTLRETSERRSGRYRCLAEIPEGGAWGIVRCTREWG